MRHSCLASLFAAYVQDGLLDTTPSFRVVLMLETMQVSLFLIGAIGAPDVEATLDCL